MIPKQLQTWHIYKDAHNFAQFLLTGMLNTVMPVKAKSCFSPTDTHFCAYHSRWLAVIESSKTKQKKRHLLRSSKTSGRRKLSRDQSSAKLFCSGVPVSSSLLSVGSIFSSRTSRQLRFLILWPSSTIRYFHWKRYCRTQTQAKLLSKTLRTIYQLRKEVLI